MNGESLSETDHRTSVWICECARTPVNGQDEPAIVSSNARTRKRRENTLTLIADPVSRDVVDHSEAMGAVFGRQVGQHGALEDDERGVGWCLVG